MSTQKKEPRDIRTFFGNKNTTNTDKKREVRDIRTFFKNENNKDPKNDINFLIKEISENKDRYKLALFHYLLQFDNETNPAS